MMFACPGGCGKRHPLADGQLVWTSEPGRRHDVSRRRRTGVPEPRESLLVILCAPCTAQLVLDRAKVRT